MIVRPPVTLIVALITVSTPVLLAAIGELVVEKSGCAEPRGQRG